MDIYTMKSNNPSFLPNGREFEKFFVREVDDEQYKKNVQYQLQKRLSLMEYLNNKMEYPEFLVRKKDVNLRSCAEADLTNIRLAADTSMTGQFQFYGEDFTETLTVAATKNVVNFCKKNGLCSELLGKLEMINGQPCVLERRSKNHNLMFVPMDVYEQKRKLPKVALESFRFAQSQSLPIEKYYVAVPVKQRYEHNLIGYHKHSKHKSMRYKYDYRFSQITNSLLDQIFLVFPDPFLCGYIPVDLWTTIPVNWCIMAYIAEWDEK